MPSLLGVVFTLALQRSDAGALLFGEFGNDHCAVDDEASAVGGGNGAGGADGLDFGVQIGLTENGEAVLGVVFLPFHDELFYAVKDEGAFVIKQNAPPEKLQVSGKTDFAQMTLAVSRNHLSPKMSAVSKNFQIGNVVHRGSVGLKVGLIARQTADLYIHLSPRTKYWDSCAPQIILEEAGGKMTDIFGVSLRYDLHDVQNHNGILASNGAAHDSTVEKLRPLLNDFGRSKIIKANTFT